MPLRPPAIKRTQKPSSTGRDTELEELRATVEALRQENEALKLSSARQEDVATQARVDHKNMEAALNEMKELRDSQLRREQQLASLLAEHGISSLTGLSVNLGLNEAQEVTLDGSTQRVSDLTAKIRAGVQQTQKMIQEQALLQRSISELGGLSQGIQGREEAA